MKTSESDPQPVGHDEDIVLPGTGLPGAGRKTFQPEAVQPAATASPPPRRRGGGLLPLLVLVLLAAAAALAWQWYRQAWLPTQDRLAVQAEQLALFGTRQQAVLGQQTELLTLLKQRAGSDLQWQKAQEDRLARLQQRMQRLDRDSHRQWLLAESALLLRQAERLARMEHDAIAVAEALMLADSLLAAIDDPALRPVREVLARDLQRLHRLPAVDRVGLYLRLDAVMAGLENWPLADMAPLATPSAVEAQPGAWYQRGQQWLARLRGLVVLRPREARDQALLAPAEVGLLQQNIRLQLQQAQWAVLHAEPAVYAASLKRARVWADRFEAADPQVNAALVALAGLAGASVAAPEISIAPTLKALAAYQAGLHAAQEADAVALP